MNRITIAYPLTIYYDRSCPLCAEEMHALKQYDVQGKLSLIDCSTPDFCDPNCQRAGITQQALMRRIHARDAAGRWLDGVAVFEAAYRVAGIESVARLWGSPRLQLVWDRIYMWIAANRMWLSRLRLNKLYGHGVRLAARRAARRSGRCAEQGNCPVDTSAR